MTTKLTIDEQVYRKPEVREALDDLVEAMDSDLVVSLNVVDKDGTPAVFKITKTVAGENWEVVKEE